MTRTWLHWADSTYSRAQCKREYFCCFLPFASNLISTEMEVFQLFSWNFWQPISVFLFLWGRQESEAFKWFGSWPVVMLNNTSMGRDSGCLVTKYNGSVICNLVFWGKHFVHKWDRVKSVAFPNTQVLVTFLIATPKTLVFFLSFFFFVRGNRN